MAGSIIVSIVIFLVAVYLFWITNRKIANIRADLIQKEVRNEMEALVTEFNRAANRNVEIIEDRIEALNKVIEKANKKMIQLDGKIARSKNPIVIEKIVEKKIPANKIKRKTVDIYIGKKNTAVQDQQPPVETTPKKRQTITSSPNNNTGQQFAEHPTSPKDKKQKAVDIFMNTDDSSSAGKEKALLDNNNTDNKRKRLEVIHNELPPTDIQKTFPKDTSKLFDTSKKPLEKQSRSDRLKGLLNDGKSTDELIELGFLENEISLMSFLLKR